MSKLMREQGINRKVYGELKKKKCKVEVLTYPSGTVSRALHTFKLKARSKQNVLLLQRKCFNR